MKLILAATLLLAGCADWTPEQAAALNNAMIVGGASILAVGVQPQYYAPPPMPVVTHCYTYGNRTSCTTY
jgi:hypothetical protein